MFDQYQSLLFNSVVLKEMKSQYTVSVKTSFMLRSYSHNLFRIFRAMKNEERIIELLEESLKKQDIQERLLLVVGDLVEVQRDTNQRLLNIENNLTEVNELRKRIEEIERYIGLK